MDGLKDPSGRGLSFDEPSTWGRLSGFCMFFGDTKVIPQRYTP